ncbi:hypothetical protein M3J09_002331 [Ascochyta lentis]
MEFLDAQLSACEGAHVLSACLPTQRTTRFVLVRALACHWGRGSLRSRSTFEISSSDGYARPCRDP